MSRTTVEIPIFPLGTVLYPQGLLPLRIFEARYVDMTKACIGDDEVFGVCLIREGNEVGAPATPEDWGCTARIQHWDVPAPGLFTLLAQGEQRFRIRERYTTPSGLARALVQIEEPPPSVAVPERHRGLLMLLEDIAAKVGGDQLPMPLRLDDAAWVAWRLAELLPLSREDRVALLHERDAEVMLDRIGRFMASAQDRATAAQRQRD